MLRTYAAYIHDQTHTYAKTFYLSTFCQRLETFLFQASFPDIIIDTR